MKWKDKQTWFLAAACVVVLAAGFIYSIKLGDSLRYWDEKEYFIYVKNFLSNHIFSFTGNLPTAQRPPGYPFLLMFFGLLGANHVALRMLNFIALAGSLIILYLWLKEQCDAWAGVIGLGLFACYPVLFYTAGTFFPQTFGAFLFLVALYLASKRPLRLWQAAAAGLVFGVLILTIPTFAYGIPLIALWMVLREKKWKSAVMFVVLSCLVIGIWTWRNYRVFHTFFFVTTDSGFNLLMGNAPETTPNSGLTIDFDKYKKLAAGLDEVQADAFYRNKAIGFILEDKTRAVRLYFAKFINYFNYRNDLRTAGEASSLNDLVMLMGYGGLILVLLVRIAAFRKIRFTDLEILLLILYLISAAVYAVFFTRIRFRLPFDYLLIAVDAMFLRQLIIRWPKRAAAPGKEQ